jgi:hypothetical protein
VAYALPPSEPDIEPSFADALAAIASSDLAPHRKQHWVCSLRMTAKALDWSPETIPAARWTAVRPAIRRLHHAMSGNREKTLQNHKANVRRALVWFAGEHDVSGRGVPLTPEWRSLRQGIPDLGRRNHLAGLMRYCSGKGIAPEQVTEAVIDAYMARTLVIYVHARPRICGEPRVTGPGLGPMPALQRGLWRAAYRRTNNSAPRQAFQIESAGDNRCCLSSAQSA